MPAHDAKTMDWQSWHMPRDAALCAIASPDFSHARALYVGFMGAYECRLYRKDKTSPTGVRLIGSAPDCEEISNAIRARGSAIEPPHA